jgi:DNA-binding CsgD family transcriptional regulator
MLAAMASPGDPLVGRAAEPDEIDRALDDLARGRPRCVAIEGEPGIGKTRLLEGLGDRAEARGYLVLGGVASEFEASVPFAVLTDALDPYVAAVRDDLDADWLASLSADLADVLPSLAAQPAMRLGSEERYRVHRAMRDLLTRLAGPRPLVITLDDAHWADDASLELLQALVRRPADGAVLLALAYRAGQAPVRLKAALAAPAVTRVAPGPLTRDEAAELLGMSSDAAALASLYRRGGGNPFYLEQLARTGEAGRSGPGAAGDVPSAIAASVAAELDPLPPDALALARSAAVVGEPFDLDLAATIADLDAEAGLRALDVLLDDDLVRPTEVPRRFRFRHPLVRRAIYENSQAGWRLGAHGRAADALAARGASASARAHHVEQAAHDGDRGAIAVLVAAGDESSDRAPAVAARWYEAALRLLPATDLDGAVTVRTRLAQALRSAGDLEGSRAALHAAIEALDDPTDPRRIALSTRCAAVERWLGRDAEARARLVQARAEAVGDEAAAALEIELCVGAVFDRQLEVGIEHGSAAMAMVGGADAEPLRAAAAAALCLAETGAGRVAQARRHRAEAISLLQRLSDAQLSEHVDALYHLAWAENYLEHFADAVAHVDRMLRIARTGGGGRPLVPMLLVTSYPLLTLGRLADAADVCDRAVEASRLDGAAHFRAWALFERSWAHYYAGELGQAMTCAQESMHLLRRDVGGTGPTAGTGPVWAMAGALVQSGQPEHAAEVLAAVGGDDVPGAMPVERAFNWETLALVAIGRGRHADAQRLVGLAEADAARYDLALPRGLADRIAAAVALARGDAAAAARRAARGADAFATVGARIEVAYTRNVQGRALAQAGDRDAAVAVLRAAEAELDACGALRERDAARRELRRLGARAEVRGPATGALAGAEALTVREREIADLVTDRRTNREIAAALFLSEKTVESHLRNVFAKLGVSSRVEVARAIEQAPAAPRSPRG